MIPLEVSAYFPASTGGVVVWEERDGEAVDLDPAMSVPTLGLALTVPMAKVRRARLIAELRADGRARSWDSDPALSAFWGMTAADFGWRWGPGQSEGSPEGGVVSYWWGCHGGPRVGWLVAPPWEPWVAWGLGAQTGMGMAYGKGPVRAVVEARMGMDIVAEAVTGTLDTAKVDMGWTWTPMAMNVSLRVGAAFR